MIRFLEPPLVLFLLFLFVLAARFNVSPAISSVTAISRDQVACTMCSSCDNPCQPILSPPAPQPNCQPPPPPSEPNCRPPPLPPPPSEPKCPPPPLPPPPSEPKCPPPPLPPPPSEPNCPPPPLPPPPSKPNCPPLPSPESKPPPRPLRPPFPSGGGGRGVYSPIYGYNRPPSADIFNSAGMMAKCSTLSAIFPLLLILSSFIG